MLKYLRLTQTLRHFTNLEISNFLKQNCVNTRNMASNSENNLSSIIKFCELVGNLKVRVR